MQDFRVPLRANPLTADIRNKTDVVDNFKRENGKVIHAYTYIE